MDQRDGLGIASIKESTSTENTRGKTGVSLFPGDLKTIVLWIYNINQNGAANTFYEDVSQYFTTGQEGNVLLRDMSQDMLSEFLKSISTAKEITLRDLGIRLVLLIYNCNQNGVNNTAGVACENIVPESDLQP
jgi:hypothetical protein